jgi:soluble lytic murein transglycosylase-like protein
MGTFEDTFDMIINPIKSYVNPKASASIQPMRPPQQLPAKPSFVATPYDSYINASSAKYKVDPNFVKSMTKVESQFNPNATSKANAKGLMQLTPITIKELQRQKLNINNPYDPQQNIEGGTKYLANMIKRFDGNLEHAIAAYNMGPVGFKNINRDIRRAPKETRDHVERVMKYYKGGIK